MGFSCSVTASLNTRHLLFLTSLFAISFDIDSLSHFAFTSIFILHSSLAFACTFLDISFRWTFLQSRWLNDWPRWPSVDEPFADYWVVLFTKSEPCCFIASNKPIRQAKKWLHSYSSCRFTLLIARFALPFQPFCLYLLQNWPRSGVQSLLSKVVYANNVER